jgi:hypothetical protein
MNTELKLDQAIQIVTGALGKLAITKDEHILLENCMKLIVENLPKPQKEEVKE